MKKLFFSLVVLIIIFLGFFGNNQSSSAQDETNDNGKIKPEALRQIQALMQEKESRTPAQQKIDSNLLYTIKMERNEMIAENVPNLETGLKVDGKGFVEVNILAHVTERLMKELKRVNAEIINSLPKYRSITARLPITAIESIAEMEEIIFIMPKQEAMVFGSDFGGTRKNNLFSNFEDRSQRVRNFISSNFIDNLSPQTGNATSEGDTTHQANLFRSTTGFNGAGIKIGVISTSVHTLPLSQATGDLPPNVIVLPGQSGIEFCQPGITPGCDEGTAMLEIVHDIAPGAQLYYATSSPNIAQFAKNIIDLRLAGCDIIIDDISYSDETPFQNGQLLNINSLAGIVVQAVNEVTANGALYFSAAGNFGNKNDGTSGVWEGDFADSGFVYPDGNMHDFGGGFRINTIFFGSGRSIDLKWSDPLGVSNNDYDLYILNPAGNIIGGSNNTQNGFSDPYESAPRTLNVTNNIIVIVKKFSGSGRFLHLNTNGSRLAISTPGQVYGHNAGVNTISIAATPARNAFGPPPNPIGPFPNAFNSNNKVELFSSDGPRRIFYNTNGTAITPGNVSSTGGILLQKPDITAADGTTTTTPNFIPFSGTSAAAPHAGALAALLKSACPAATNAQIINAMKATAIDIEAAGTDRDSGAGIVMPIPAKNALCSTTVSVTVQTNPAGRSFTVDGSPFTSPQTFNWQSGSSHTIATTSPQNGTTGTRYVWSNWSDNGAISHTVAPTSNTTYTANFTTQHFLTMNAGTGGTVSPSSNWFNTGQAVQISAAPNSGFNFNGWTGTGSGSFTGTNNPATVTMNSPISQTANFSSTPVCTYQINPSGQNVGASAGNGSFAITANAGCQWQAVSNVNWASTNSNGNGNGTINYSYAANPTTQSRTGQIVVGGRTFDLTQAGQQTACTYSITPSSRNFTASGGTGSFTVAAPNGCAWNVIASSSLLDELIGNNKPTFSIFDSDSLLNNPTAIFPANAGTLGSIPDGPSTTAQTPGAPRDVTFTVSGISGTVSNVEISITGTHTFVGDLQATLIAPNGTSHRLFGYTRATDSDSQNGDGSDLGGTYIFKDSATSPPSGGWWQEAAVRNRDEIITPGNYRTTNSGGTGATDPMPPTSMNAAFAGVSTINGTWTLRITDGAAGDIGSITAASLTVTGSTNPANWLTITSGSNGNGNGTVNYSVPQYIGPRRTGTITLSANGQTQAVHTVNQFANTPFDYDGDGKADISVFRPSNGVWYLNRTQAGFTGAQFGVSTDKLVPADYDGDGKTDIAVYRSGVWYLLRSQLDFTGFAFGEANDIPQPADFDGDGKAELAVYRPSNGIWYVFNLANNQFTFAQFGASTDKPVVGDYDGDGRANFAVFRPSNGFWYIARPTGVPAQNFDSKQLGESADKPVPADYDGDGKTDVAVFRPSNGTWYLQRSTENFTGVQFGISTDLPAPADYDGDGRADVSVFRSGNWYRFNSSNGAFYAELFGLATDKPVSNAFVP